MRDDATGRRVGRIVEVEAYGGPEDRASHARFGRRARNAVMFGPAGIAYVYLVYGMYDCLNVVTGSIDAPGAVLVRSVQPLAGLARMRADRAARAVGRRHVADAAARMERETHRLAVLPLARLSSGPGLVAAAFGIDRSWTGTDLCDPSSPLRLEAPPEPIDEKRIVATPRIGIDYAGDPWVATPWRVVLDGEPAVSGPRARRPAR